jgi:PKD repeat protein
MDNLFPLEKFVFMPKLLRVAFVFSMFFPTIIFAQQICNPNGNLVVFSNYDGGSLNIVVDANIPNLKIGIVSYEAVAINISGPFASNVTGVIYAGYNANNNHCNPNVPTTTISGVAMSLVNVQIMPPANVPDPNGYGLIICAYNCTSTGSAGGCNTAQQITGYFLSAFPGAILHSHRTQYACWSGTNTIANGGNCCIAPVIPLPPIAQIHASQTQICPGDCIQFTDSSLHLPTTWVWNFPGGVPAIYNGQQPGLICFSNRGTYQASLSVSNAHGTSNQSLTIQVQGPDTSVQVNGLTLTSLATGPNITYQWMRCSDGWQTIPGATSISYTAPQNGDYAVILSDGNCTDTSRCIAITTFAANDYKLSEHIYIFPNPAQSQIFIDGPPTILHRAKVSIYSMDGRLLKSPASFIPGAALGIDDLTNGIYLMRLQLDGENVVKTFVIQR